MHTSFPRLCVGYAEMLSSSRFVAFVFLLGEERSDCHHLMVVRWVPCAFNMHDLGFFRPRSLSSESGLSLLAVFFSFASLSKRGFHPVARGRCPTPRRGFPSYCSEEKWASFCNCEVVSDPHCSWTVSYDCFVFCFCFIILVPVVFTLKIQSLPIKDFS